MNILPVSTELTLVVLPLGVLTGSITGAGVSTGSSVVSVTNTGVVVVTGGRVVTGSVGGTVAWLTTVVEGNSGRVVVGR